MLILNAAQNTQPDYLALAIALAMVVVVVIMVIRKRFFTKSAEPVAAPAPVVENTQPQAVAPGAAGQLKLHNVSPKTAAMLMAIVADKTGKPLNELRFISIKEVE